MGEWAPRSITALLRVPPCWPSLEGWEAGPRVPPLCGFSLPLRGRPKAKWQHSSPCITAAALESVLCAAGVAAGHQTRTGDEAGVQPRDTRALNSDLGCQVQSHTERPGLGLVPCRPWEEM